MRKLLLFAVIISFYSIALAQYTSEIVYTLQEGEVIMHDENELEASFSDNFGYWLLIQSLDGDKIIENGNITNAGVDGSYMVFKGDEYRSPIYRDGSYYHINKGIEYGPYENSGLLYHHNNNSFGFSYDENEKSYVNLNGIKYGPYEYCGILKGFENSSFAFYYEIEQMYYLNVNGINYGPYDYLEYYNIAFNEKGNFAFGFDRGGLSFCNINGTEYGPYNIANNITMTQNNKFGFVFSSGADMNVYANVNGKIYGPYTNIEYYQFSMFDNGFFAFPFEKDGKYFFNYNGEEIGPYDWSDGFYCNKESYYGFCFRTKDGYFMKTKNKVFGPYPGISGYSFEVNSKGDFKFLIERDNKYYVNINGIESGPFDNYYYTYITDRGIFYYYEIDDKYYVSINGKSNGPFDYISNLQVTDEGYYIYEYQKDEQYYANFEGREFGPYTYIWTTINNGQTTISGDIEGKYFDEYSIAYDPFNLKTYLSGDTKHSMEMSYNYDYVKIDGEKVGKGPGFIGMFSKKDSAFKWFSLEGNNIVKNTYKVY